MTERKKDTESFIGRFFTRPIGGHGQRPPLVETEPLLGPTEARRGIESGRENREATLVIRVPKGDGGHGLASAAKNEGRKHGMGPAHSPQTAHFSLHNCEL